LKVFNMAIQGIAVKEAYEGLLLSPFGENGCRERAGHGYDGSRWYLMTSLLPIVKVKRG